MFNAALVFSELARRALVEPAHRASFIAQTGYNYLRSFLGHTYLLAN